jgi:HupE / UreJ protein
LADLGLKESSRLWGLLGFNLGVEIGQLALVIVFLPIAYKLSRYPLYKPVVLKSCSIGIAGLASLWLFERIFNTSVIV